MLQQHKQHPKSAPFSIDVTAPDPGSTGAILAGMLMILQYDLEAELQADHEIIWFGDYEASIRKMTGEEFDYLIRMGWHEDQGAWSLFV